MKNSFRIAEISLGSPIWDAAFSFEIEKTHFECQRFGANHSLEYAKWLIQQLSKDVDAIAMTNFPAPVSLRNKSYVNLSHLEIMNHPTETLLHDGATISSLLSFQSIDELIKNKKINVKDGILFPFTLKNLENEEFIRNYFKGHVIFGDLLTSFQLPFLLQPQVGALSAAKVMLSFSSLFKNKTSVSEKESVLKKIKASILRLQSTRYEYVFDDIESLLSLQGDLSLVKNKTCIVKSHHPLIEKELLRHKPKSIIHLLPEKYFVSPYMNFSILEACLTLLSQKNKKLSFTDWENLLSHKTDLQQPTRQYSLKKSESLQQKVVTQVYKTKNRLKSEDSFDFAFIVHALSHKDFQKVPGMGPVVKLLPSKMRPRFDQLIGQAPGIPFGQIRNIESKKTGQQVNGMIYALLTVPKVLKESDPELIYKKIEKICYDAHSKGAKIIGLGAYTKMIGDSGLTINQNSPIPVTTGNSLSASATLWALNEVAKKLKLITIDQNNGLYNGEAMVIGATGAIGKVSAKLLSLVFKKLILVAPQINRLEALKRELSVSAPWCEIIVTNDSNAFASSVDALVTATSAMGESIIDVMRLKPGCIVCDCSRPLDFSIEEAKKRPDILIIESGEVELPGPVSLTCQLGLPGNSVYACLAETAILSLEKRYEPFTLGRDIDWKKVKEIYKMSTEHGLRLAAIQGHMGFITDKEIELTRKIALSRLRQKTF